MDKSAILEIKSLICSVKGEYGQEVTYLKQAIKIDVDGFGEYRCRVIELILRLATAYQNNQQPGEAVKVLTHYQKIAEEMLGMDAPLSAAIRNQLMQLCQYIKT